MVTPEHGEQLKLTGKTTDVEPTIHGSSPLQTYRAIVDNAWAWIGDAVPMPLGYVAGLSVLGGEAA